MGLFEDIYFMSILRIDTYIFDTIYKGLFISFQNDNHSRIDSHIFQTIQLVNIFGKTIQNIAIGFAIYLLQSIIHQTDNQFIIHFYHNTTNYLVFLIKPTAK